ncbi:von Willebrand and RING finger domain-containing protein [Lophium mytilinum]|uniref:von Willebrand and RING finger domain-containing protein n=1 Tax=Lophium mytilinum TaxID=390894 RepID=A0A6A6QZW6_9PEZI|nr:von Willebrand and RING finger domain-containing protein [Lophium mytilinum]
MLSYSGLRPRSRQSQLSSDTAKPLSSRSTSSHSPHPRSSRGMAGVLDIERTRTRRERTFIGSECSVCEEPLEHTLRGERILQLSCGHVAHEACFYEYIREFESQTCPTCEAPLGLDTSRGGNVLDLEKLSTLVRSVQHSDTRDNGRSTQVTPTPWDTQTVTENPRTRDGPELQNRPPPQQQQQHHDPRGDHRQRESSHSRESRERSERMGSSSRQHNRNDSGATGAASSGDYADTHNPTGRRHDYDVQSMETSLSSPRSLLKNPIPAPTVTVRSEFPTLNRSRQQQSLTCLITIEVVEGKWRPDPEDMRTVPPVPSIHPSENYGRSKSPAPSRALDSLYESPEVLDEVTEDLHSRVDNWHGLDFSRFGKLRLHGHVRVGKDRQSWQELECYLFSEMLICVKEKKVAQAPHWDGAESVSKKTKCTLKGSILIKKHLKQVEHAPDEAILTLSLSVAELPSFHLQFQNRNQLEPWRRALLDINMEPSARVSDYDHDNSGTDEDDYRTSNSKNKRVSSGNSSYGAARSTNTAPTEYTNSRVGMPDMRASSPIHVPLDIVVVIPVSSSMQGLKINLLRDALRFMVSNLGERDRMGLVTFGSSGGGVPLVGMTSKAWNGWPKVLDSIRPVGQKSLRADVVEGANVAMDLLMQRKSTNPLSSIMLISDSSTSDAESVDFVVSRAEAAKVAIHSFGLGLTHKPDTMIELSTRTKASYTYVKDWMMLRECVAGCLGSLQTTSHQNVKLKLRLPEGSPAKFVKISGALQITKRATGRDAEASLGDLRFGDKRDILVQLAIAPDTASPEQLPQDPWETIVSGLEALGGPLDQDDQRSLSVEEVPLIQADLVYGDILREGSISHLPRPSLLAITMLPSTSKKNSTGRPSTPPIPPHPSVVQRRMELLTSDMLTRALTLVSRGQHERAHHLLSETRSILKGLGKGGLPPLPPPGGPRGSNGPSAPSSAGQASPMVDGADRGTERPRTPSPHAENPFTPAAGIDATTMYALDAELESSLEWMNHPAVFGRDSRKAVLQAIGVISSQRGYTFRTPSESLWAERITGVKRLSERSREWREAGDEALMEEN